MYYGHLFKINENETCKGNIMQLIKPRVLVYKLHAFDTIKKLIELNARRCYRSEDKIEEGSADKIIKRLVKLNHGAMLEFGTICVEFTCDRGVSHELIRHRIASFAQQSTRYCDEGSEDKFGGVNFIEPFFASKEQFPVRDIRSEMSIEVPSFDAAVNYNELENNEIQIGDAPKANLYYNQTESDIYIMSFLFSEWAYNTLREKFGVKPQEARAVLPNALRTVIGTQMNIREWLHTLNLRTKKEAHPQIRQIMIPLLHFFNEHFPIIFGSLMKDIAYEYNGKIIPLPEVEVVEI